MENKITTPLSEIKKYHFIDRVSVRLEAIGATLAAVLILATMLLVASL